jgi:hypothetical protein
MVNVKPLVMLSHLIVIKLCPIVSYYDFRKPKSTNNVFPEQRNHFISGDLC